MQVVHSACVRLVTMSRAAFSLQGKGSGVDLCAVDLRCSALAGFFAGSRSRREGRGGSGASDLGLYQQPSCAHTWGNPAAKLLQFVCLVVFGFSLAVAVNFYKTSTDER